MAPFDRRSFLRTSAATLALAPLAGLDRLPLSAAPRKSRVALVRTRDRKAGVTQALKLFDPKGIGGKRVLIKPNFNSADPTPGSTHVDTLGQLVAELHARGARSVTLGECSGPPAGSTKGIMERKGIFDLARQGNFDIVNYEEIGESDWVAFQSEHWPQGFHLPRHVVEAEYNVSTCCLKTHGYGGVFTMSLKLSVGLTPRAIRRDMHRSPDMRRMIAELNTGYRPRLIVLDGIDCFTDGGPGQGTLKQGNVMLVSDDRVAIDAVGVAVLKELGSNSAIMGRKIFEQEQIARAIELKLGAESPAAIELVTGDAASAAYAAKLRGILDLG